MKICTKCGSQMNDNAMFCTVCGTNYSQPQAQPFMQPQQPVQPQFQAQQPVQPGFQPQFGQAPVRPQFNKPSFNNSSTAMILKYVLMAISALMCLFTFLPVITENDILNKESMSLMFDVTSRDTTFMFVGFLVIIPAALTITFACLNKRTPAMIFSIITAVLAMILVFGIRGILESQLSSLQLSLIHNAIGFYLLIIGSIAMIVTGIMYFVKSK